MPKFYVRNGNIRELITADDSWSAAMTFLRDHKGEILEIVTAVNEHGFGDDRHQVQVGDRFFSTKLMLKRLEDADS